MGLQWTIITSFLYLEIVVIFLFLLPFISPLAWRKLFKSNFILLISTYSHFYIRVAIFALSVAFLNSIWHLRKYNIAVEKLDNITVVTPRTGQNQYLNLIQTQRNFYISGFSLFLWLVLNHLVKMTTMQAQLKIDLDVCCKRAISATKAAHRLMKASTLSAVCSSECNKVENMAIIEKEDTAKRVQAFKMKLEKAEEELCKARIVLKENQIDVMAMKSQSEATKREYDRLMEDYSILQKKTK